MCNNGHTCDFMTSTCSVCGTTECEMLESDTPCPGPRPEAYTLLVRQIVDAAMLATFPAMVIPQ